MPTQEMSFQGKLSWVRVVNVDKYGAWSANIHPNDKSLEDIRDLQAKGLKNMIKKDPDGYYTKFRCDPQKTIRGKQVTFPRPFVVDKDGKPMDGLNIGNGSDGTLICDVYDHPTPAGGRAYAARLKGVRIDNLIPFQGHYTQEEADQMKGLKDVPEQFF